MPAAVDKIWAKVNAYLDSHNGRPQFIAMPPEDYNELKQQTNATLPLKMHYDPKYFYGVPIVVAPKETEIKCLPQ